MQKNVLEVHGDSVCLPLCRFAMFLFQTVVQALNILER